MKTCSDCNKPIRGKNAILVANPVVLIELGLAKKDEIVHPQCFAKRPPDPITGEKAVEM